MTNLTLRRATKAGIIDRDQHNAIMALYPKAETGEGLDARSLVVLDSWQSFGEPVAVGMMGVMDLRSLQVPAREAWLEREVEPYGEWPEGITADHYRKILWPALDGWRVSQATKAIAPKDDG